MTNTFHILNDAGLEKLTDHLVKNQKTTESLPTHLIQDTHYYTDSGIAFDISDMAGMDLWEVGKKLVPIIDNNSEFHTYDTKCFWGSMSLYFAELILPKTDNGKPCKQLEVPRYALATGRNRYKHLLYSAYFCYKYFSDDSKFILTKNVSHTAFADRLLGRPSLYRYPIIYKKIQDMYINHGINKNVNDKKNNGNNGCIENFMMFCMQYAVNHSLHNNTDFESAIPDIFKNYYKEQ